MTKCNRCNQAIDRDRDAFVTMPNAEQCGYRSRRPTAFAHARCFEKDVKAAYEQELKNRAIDEAEAEASSTAKYVGERYFDPKAWSSAGFTFYAIAVPHKNGPWEAIFCRTEELAKQVIDALAGTRAQVSCKARTANVGANDPQDCDWPFCGCDHAADKVLETLQESGVCLKRNCATQAQAAQPELICPLCRNGKIEDRPEMLAIGPYCTICRSVFCFQQVGYLTSEQISDCAAKSVALGGRKRISASELIGNLDVVMAYLEEDAPKTAYCIVKIIKARLESDTAVKCA